MAPGPLRQQVLDTPTLRGSALCRALSDHTDGWFASLFAEALGGADPGGFALAAVGGYGRRELSPQSDIDVLLITTRRTDVSAMAEALWYPVWDEGLKLGHAVRTVDEALDLASGDLDTATSLLALRHVAGDPALSHHLAERALALWRKRADRWLGELSASVRSRHRRAGDAAFLLEPDLKDGRGGLRDVHAIRWAQAARPVMLAGDDDALSSAYSVLLDARVELHRRTGRRGDVLLLQEQDAVARSLGFADTDTYMRQLSAAARNIAWRSDEVWERVDASLEGPSLPVIGRRLKRRPEVALAAGVVLRDGRVHIDAATTSGAADPLLVLRVAVAAASEGARIDRESLQLLASTAPPLPDPWPAEARDLFAQLWLTGAAAIDVVESLDQVGVWSRVVPEWDEVRAKPQRNAYHTFTVDRHLCQTAANAAALTDRVDRADLLVVGALLHDIGKGWPGDHTEVGIDLVEGMARRMGYTRADTAVLVDMVRHHLLLPDVATRRDLDDDATLAAVAEAVGDRRTLALLGALCEADSLATGPAAWGEWKEGLVRQLVSRVDHVLAGGAVDDVVADTFPTTTHRERMASGELWVEAGGDTLTVIAADRPGLFARVAGVLALSGMDVLAADLWSDDGMALEVFRVAPPADPERAWERVRRDLPLAMDGQFALTARLADRAAQTPARRALPGIATPEVRIDNDASRVATVVEVVADDAVGLLARIAATLAELRLDICSAKVQTLGPQVVDAFYVVDAHTGTKVTDDAHLGEVRRALGHVIGI
jgi:[protein-PII] uridylyltransferase